MRSITLVAILAISCALPLQAFELLVNGFGTVCGSKSDLPKYYTVNYPVYPFLTQLGSVTPYVSSVVTVPAYVGAERRWNFLPNSKFGLQFTSIFDDKFKAIVQIVGRAETMTNDNYVAKMDWAYLQYDYNNQVNFQFGRFRLPAFYYSDYLEVNHAQPWVIPPEEVYFIVGGAFRNVDGINARTSYYMGDWTWNNQLYFGSFQEDLSILNREITVKVRDVIGIAAQFDNDIFTFRGSVMRSIYSTNLNDPLIGLVQMTNTVSGSTSSAAQNLMNYLSDDDQSIIYTGLAVAVNFGENFDFLAERASILSPGIISTARKGMYASLTYSLEKLAITFTTGYSRPLETEDNKYRAVQAFFSTPQYINFIDKNSGAGAAVVQQFQSYLGSQRSYAVDLRYDIIPSVALKGRVQYIRPAQNGPGIKYLLNRVATVEPVWVYRVSFDFVF